MGETSRHAESFEGRPKCGTCVHWHRDQGAVGSCRRYPPPAAPTPMQHPLKPNEVTMMWQSAFPPTSEGLYCAEHPEFMVWYSRNRDNAGAIDALERDAVAAS